MTATLTHLHSRVQIDGQMGLRWGEPEEGAQCSADLLAKIQSRECYAGSHLENLS